MKPAADSGQPAVFLDRDGTLMRDVAYCSDPEAIEIFPGVPEALRRLRENGYKLLVITNQSGIGRGYFTDEQYRVVEAEFLRRLGPDLIAGTYYCSDLPDSGSKRRKPSPEMVFEAGREHGIDLARSFFVGDKEIDVQCGFNAGVRTILLRNDPANENETTSDWVASDLVAATEVILEQTK